MAKKPNIDDFRKILRKSGGNLTKVAATFKVARKTIYQWAKEDVEFKDAISDERGALVDECLVSARVLALGIPEKDEKGNFIGWRERPDGYMIRYGISQDKLYHSYQVTNDSTSLDLNSLEANRKYYFSIAAFNENGVGNYVSYDDKGL